MAKMAGFFRAKYPGSAFLVLTCRKYGYPERGMRSFEWFFTVRSKEKPRLWVRGAPDLIYLIRISKPG